MAESDLCSAQMEVNTCSDHEHEEVEMYCRTCGNAICTKCVKGDHREHDWETIMKIAKELRKQTNKEFNEKVVAMSMMNGIGDMIDSITSEANTEHASICSKLESKRKCILETVNTIFGELKSKCENKHKSKMDQIEEYQMDYICTYKRAKFLIRCIESSADSTDLELIEIHKEMGEILDELQKLAVPPSGVRDRMVYNPGSSDMQILASLVGSLEEDSSSPEVILEKELKHFDTNINAIHILSENEAWVHPIQTTMTHLVDSSGNIKKSVDLGCKPYNFTVSTNNDIYFCDDETHTVKNVDEQGNITTLFSTSPFSPVHIYMTRWFNFLISLFDGKAYDRNRRSRRLVRRTSMTGEVIMEYEFDNDGKSPLFSKPWRPIELHNGNICVIDITGEAFDPVYCFDFRGKVHFKYTGIDGRFNPIDICCDNEGNIFASDSGNKRVHVIDLNGHLLRYLLTVESFTEDIFAIAVFGRKIWIGSFESPMIKVYKLKYK